MTLCTAPAGAQAAYVRLSHDAQPIPDEQRHNTVHGTLHLGKLCECHSVTVPSASDNCGRSPVRLTFRDADSMRFGFCHCPFIHSSTKRPR
jgi:hypothetical protein